MEEHSVYSELFHIIFYARFTILRSFVYLVIFCKISFDFFHLVSLLLHLCEKRVIVIFNFSMVELSRAQFHGRIKLEL